MTNWTPEQQKEHRKLWVEALRSGKYQQARGALRKADGSMCCLGVACELSGLGTWDGSTYLTPDGENDGELETPDVREWLGLADRVGGLARPIKEEDSLAELNDHGATFAEIAEIIESEPLGLIADA